jgi:hypothetical protein
VHFAVAGDGSAAVAIRGEVVLRQPLGPAGLPQDPAELNDLSIDPDASVDLSAAEPATVGELKAKLRGWLESWREQPDPTAPPDAGDPVEDAAAVDGAR